jgi:hypothetical protein
MFGVWTGVVGGRAALEIAIDAAGREPVHGRDFVFQPRGVDVGGGGVERRDRVRCGVQESTPQVSARVIADQAVAEA